MLKKVENLEPPPPLLSIHNRSSVKNLKWKTQTIKKKTYGNFFRKKNKSVQGKICHVSATEL